jgi:hypothetical protein
VIDKKTVFVLGAGASCPYGYPTGSELRKLICFEGGFLGSYIDYLRDNKSVQNTKEDRRREVNQFRKFFKDANIKSIDVFMANNPKLALIGKYIIAYEIFISERNSCFGEEAKRKQEQLEDLRKDPDKKSYLWKIACFEGGDWYFYLYNRLIEGLVGKDALPDFSDSKLAFITFNYDRSLEHFLYESLRNSFTEVSENDVVKSLKKLKILHVYGQVASLKWQNPDDYVDYKPQTDEPLLQLAAKNIRTIYEEKQNPELIEAQNLLKQAEQIFFLGFGYAPENMEVLNLIQMVSPVVQVYGTAFNLEPNEINNIHRKIDNSIPATSKGYKHQYNIKVENMDCLKLLRNYL